MSLALVLGGLGTPIFEKFCEIEYQNSIMIIRTSLQWNQYRRHELDHGLNNKKKQVKYMKNDRQKKIFEIIRNEMSSEERKKNNLNLETGASSWLKTLPIKEEG